MIKDVVSLSPDDTLTEALEMMMENGLSTMPVVNAAQKCVGMFAAVDVLASSLQLDDELRQLAQAGGGAPKEQLAHLTSRQLSGRKVEEFMATNVVHVDPESTIAAAAQTMLLNQVHHLAAVDKNQHVLGILSTMDLLSHYAESGS